MTENEKEFIEEVLKDYPRLRSRVKVLIAGTYTEYSVPAMSFDTPSGGNTHEFYSDVENYIMKKYDDSNYIFNLIRKRDVIKNSLDCLTSQEYKVIKLKYFENMTSVRTGIEMEISASTVKRKRDSAFKKLIEVGMVETIQQIDEKLTQNWTDFEPHTL